MVLIKSMNYSGYFKNTEALTKVCSFEKLHDTRSIKRDHWLNISSVSQSQTTLVTASVSREVVTLHDKRRFRRDKQSSFEVIANNRVVESKFLVFQKVKDRNDSILPLQIANKSICFFA